MLYVTIKYVRLPTTVCCIKADTTILVGALFILGDHVKCIPIYLVPLESQYSQRWCPGQEVQVISNSGVTHEMCLHPTAESPHVFTCNPVVKLLWVFGA